MENLFLDIFNELFSAGQIKGTLFGGKQEMSAVFVIKLIFKALKNSLII